MADQNDQEIAAAVPKAARQGEPGVADPIDSPAPHEWRCFHCDEVFTDRIEARVHFGYDESKTAACLLKGAEGGLLAALRDAEAQADEAIQLMHSESSEAAKAYHRARCRHTQALIEAEQLGYDRGLADGRALNGSENWRPIETAPVGVEVLLFVPGFTYCSQSSEVVHAIGYDYGAENGGVQWDILNDADGGSVDYVRKAPTLWHPIRRPAT